MRVSQATVLVVDDDDFTRTLVATLVRSLSHQVCATAASVTEAMALAHEKHPQVAVIDLDLGEGPTGIDLAHGLRRIHRDMALVMLTSYGDPQWMGQRREPPVGMRYVIKGDVNDPAVLGDAIAAALAEPRAPQRDARSASPLSEGQWEILRLVSAGFSNAEIARRRSLTVDAVNKAVSRLVRQLDLDVGDESNARALLTQAYNRLTGTVSDRRG